MENTASRKHTNRQKPLRLQDSTTLEKSSDWNQENGGNSKLLKVRMCSAGSLADAGVPIAGLLIAGYRIY